MLVLYDKGVIFVKKYKVGFTAGVFDLFHVGHLNLLERCKEQCDYLIVGICGDDYVRDIKHKEPVYPENERLRIINALKCVDEAVIVSIEATEDKMIALKEFKFDVLFSGDDWKGTERYNRTEQQFSKYGVSIEYLPYTKGVSTTGIKEKLSDK
jgi:glycerol-3-phosphate cytidylyltransferase